jgi:hypothetical protein
MYNICNHPDRMQCVDDRCWLMEGCKYLEKCTHKLVESIYSGMSCVCNYVENNLKVYKIPDCIMYTDSPTVIPTVSPTKIPTNSSILGHTIEQSAEDHVDDNLVYYIVGPCLFVMLVLLYLLRNRVRGCFKCNRVNDEEEED